MIGKYKITGMQIEGYNVVGAMLNNNIVYSKNGGEGLSCLEYTIEPANETDTLISMDPENLRYLYIPVSSITADYLVPFEYQYIEISLKDGTTAYSLDTLACLVDKIKIYYDIPEKLKIVFPYRVKTVNKFDTTNLSEAYEMFFNCNYLTEIKDISKWDMSNVTDMSGMFQRCSSLVSLDISSWDVSNVTSMGWMFSECENLTSLNISNWDARNLKEMACMFQSCSSLKTLNMTNWVRVSLSGWNSIYGAFNQCSSLTSLDLTSLDVSNVTKMSQTFNGCSSLTSLNLSNWDTRCVTDGMSMLGGVPTTVNWNYNGSNYTNWTLTEVDTYYNGTFPWNK